MSNGTEEGRGLSFSTHQCQVIQDRFSENQFRLLIVQGAVFHLSGFNKRGVNSNENYTVFWLSVRVASDETCTCRHGNLYTIHPVVL